MGLPDTAYMGVDIENLMEPLNFPRRCQPTIAETLEPREWSV